jgi:adenylyltransferase/sulfurtransferase
MTLSDTEIERYARHLVLPEIGGPGQAKLKAARVLVVGAGGLGSPLILYLAAAGVGHLGIVDDDVVSLSNLQRQVLHGEAEIGQPKVASAVAAVARLNRHVTVEPLRLRLDAANARALVSRFDVVADGCDNFDTRYTVADACEAERRPLVTAALGRFDASLTTLKPHLTRADGTHFPRYRDLFPEKPAPGVVPACAEAGVLGALAGVMGAMMALEVIREITGFGEGLAGRLILFDAMGMRIEQVEY